MSLVKKVLQGTDPKSELVANTGLEANCEESILSSMNTETFVS